jgi:hypothetical protein
MHYAPDGDNTSCPVPSPVWVSPADLIDESAEELVADALFAVVTSEELIERAELNMAQRAELAEQFNRSAERLRNARAINAQARQQLKAAIARVVRMKRQHHEPPERVLVLVKSLVHQAVPSTTAVKERDALEANAVRWAIESYYAEAS